MRKKSLIVAPMSSIALEDATVVDHRLIDDLAETAGESTDLPHHVIRCGFRFKVQYALSMANGQAIAEIKRYGIYAVIGLALLNVFGAHVLGPMILKWAGVQ